jgi:hypothetical protein
MTAYTTASPSGAEPRAFVLLKSRRRLDLLNPDPHAGTDDDLAAGLSRTIRWGGASRWEHPLSVAQHSPTVLATREADGALIHAAPRARTLRVNASTAWAPCPTSAAAASSPVTTVGARMAPLAQMQAVTASWTVSTRSPLVKRGTSFAHERPANPIPKAICTLSLGESPASLSAWLAKLSQVAHHGEALRRSRCSRRDCVSRPRHDPSNLAGARLRRSRQSSTRRPVTGVKSNGDPRAVNPTA